MELDRTAGRGSFQKPGSLPLSASAALASALQISAALASALSASALSASALAAFAPVASVAAESLMHSTARASLCVTECPVAEKVLPLCLLRRAGSPLSIRCPTHTHPGAGWQSPHELDI